MMNSCCESNGLQTLDPWPQLTTDAVDFQFENNFGTDQQSFQPLPDKEEYLQRLGKLSLYHIVYIIFKLGIIIM